MKTTTTFAKVYCMDTFIKVIQGGQSAGKNYAVAQIFTLLALQEEALFTVMTDTYDNLRDGSIRDFKNILTEEGFRWDRIYNASTKEITLGNSVIQFRYINDNREHAGKSKRRDYLYLNEGNKIGWETAATYIGRTHKAVYIDHNPDAEYWAHTELPKMKHEDGSPMSSMIIVTYRDNELCPASEIRYIEARRDNEKWYRVYGLGQTGTYSDKQIYQYDIIDEVPFDALYIISGMDFGQSPDPTVLVDLYIRGAELIADERFCANNLLPERIPGAERESVLDRMYAINFPKQRRIVGDTDGKVTILDLRKHGFDIMAVKKNMPKFEGINKVNSYKLIFTKRSTSLISGAKSWFRKTDHNGKIIPEPDGHEPDGLAAIRYGMMAYRRPAA